MKNLPLNVPAPESLRSALKNILATYGDRISTSFDDKCLYSYEIEMKDGKVFAVYTINIFVKVDHGDRVFYWPIQPEKIEINKDAALNIIRGLS